MDMNIITQEKQNTRGEKYGLYPDKYNFKRIMKECKKCVRK